MSRLLPLFGVVLCLLVAPLPGWGAIIESGASDESLVMTIGGDGIAATSPSLDDLAEAASAAMLEPAVLVPAGLMIDGQPSGLNATPALAGLLNPPEGGSSEDGFLDPGAAEPPTEPADPATERAAARMMMLLPIVVIIALTMLLGRRRRHHSAY